MVKRWFLRWSNSRPGAEQKELAITLEDRVKANALAAYIDSTDGLKLIEFTEKG